MFTRPGTGGCCGGTGTGGRRIGWSGRPRSLRTAGRTGCPCPRGFTLPGEAEVMARARAHGVPVPEVFAGAGGDIVRERAYGPTMLTELGRRPLTFRRQ